MIDTLSDFYIIISDDPLSTYSLNQTINSQSSSTHHVNVSTPSGTTVDATGYGRYVRIQSVKPGIIGFREVSVWGKVEQCNNGIDDNCDGNIDCDDQDCQPNIFNVEVVQPTCPICDDGKICIQAFRVNQISIDSGNTWITYTPGVIQCFDSLSVDTLHIMAKNNYSSCEDYDMILLYAPSSKDDGPCDNGGFEEGTFARWNGSTGTIIDGEYELDQPISSPGDRRILNTDIWEEDPLVDIINRDYGALGQYIARLGDLLPTNQVAEMTYCFEVDQDNALFSFVYAAVFDDPMANDHHTDQDRPFFQFKIYLDDSTNQVLDSVRRTSFDTAIDSIVPHPEPSRADDGETLRFLGWTCYQNDLSQFIGQTVCVEFITADCGENTGPPAYLPTGFHRAWAYIDGLCSSPEDLELEVEIDIDSILCSNQSIDAETNGVGFNEYRWKVTSLDSSGQVIDSTHLPWETGYSSELTDIKSIYEQETGSSLDCPATLKLELDVKSNCAQASDEKVVEIICDECDLSNYCDLQYLCESDTNIIYGSIDCDSCTITWTPSNYFVDPHVENPEILVDQYADALNRTYTITVVTKDSCTCSKDIRLTPNPFEVDWEIDGNICDGDLIITLNVPSFIPNDSIEIDVTNLVTNTTYYPVLDTSISDSYWRRFRVPLDHDEKTVYMIWAKLNVESGPKEPGSGNDDDCWYFQGDCYTVIELTDSIATCAYTDKWMIEVPNVFLPDSVTGVGEHWGQWDYGSSDIDWLNSHQGPFFPRFFYDPFTMNVCNPDPQPGHPFLGSAYWAELEIRERWGAPVTFIKTVSHPINSGIRVNPWELRWDGTINGQPAPSRVYVWKLRVRSFYEGPNCTLSPYYYPTENYEVYSGDVTLVR